MKTMSKTRKTLYTMILTAIFAALCFVGTFIAIPFGISKVHLGNFFCIIAGLLCGGWVGGLSGAIGMGLNDILIGGYGPDTFIRTIIVKFLMGFLAGWLFRLILRKKPKVSGVYLTLISLFTAVFVTFLVLYILNGTSFKIGERTFKNSILLFCLSGGLALFFVIVFLFSGRIKPVNQYVLLATSVACTMNIFFEFVLKIPFKMLFADMTFEAAFVYALTSLPGAVMTTIITIIFVTVIYLPVYFATHKFNRLDTLYDLIEEATTLRKKDEPAETE